MKTIFALIFLFASCYLFSQERYSDINGQKIRIKELGKGNVTVIFENGMSDSLEAWQSIPDSVAQFAHVFLYDRAGIGKSDTALQERTIPNQVNELRAVLQKEKIDPPYVLVGHSLGGLIDRYFANGYPDEVKGVLLVDPAPEAHWNSMSKKELRKYIEGGNEWYETKFPKEYRKEWYAFIPNLKYMDSLHIRKDLPFVIVSATAWEWYPKHEKIIEGMTQAEHIELEGDHYVHLAYPEKIVAYIRELVKE